MGIKNILIRASVALAFAVAIALCDVDSKKIGDLTWTTKNLNIKTPYSWCYDNDGSNCAKYGRLYTWEAAENVCKNNVGKKGEWRLPTNEDWKNLVDRAGEDTLTAGKRLKAGSGWKDKSSRSTHVQEGEDKNGNGTDSLGFSAIPGGYRYSDGSFYYVGYIGFWWSGSETKEGDDGYDGYIRYVFHNYDFMRISSNDKSYGLSVRCVKDSAK